MVKGMGGAMDLVVGAKKLIIVMEHVAKGDAPKILPECTLPLTGKRCVDMLITDLAVFNFNKDKGEMILTEIAPNTTLEEIKAKTPANYIVSDNLKKMTV